MELQAAKNSKTDILYGRAAVERGFRPRFDPIRIHLQCCVPRLCALHYLPITTRDCDTINGMQCVMSKHRTFNTRSFKLPPQVAVDGTFYMQLDDLTFWNDCNRQLYYLVNRSDLIEEFGCMNSKVPVLPPFTTAKGVFVFFVNGGEVDFRLLMTDDLGPWDENSSSKPRESAGEKSSVVPLVYSCQNQLRVVTGNNQSMKSVEFKLRTCTAVSSRCLRLQKKVAYVERGGHQFGHGIIIYRFTEPGPTPEPCERKYKMSTDIWFDHLPEDIRQELFFFFEI